MRTLVWFRGKDLRAADHAPLLRAASQGDVVPLFVLDPHHLSEAGVKDHPHRVQFALDALHALAAEISRLGSRLLVLHGPSARVLPQVVERLRIDRVLAQRTAEPNARVRDHLLRAQLKVPFELLEGETLQPPETIRTQSGTPFLVYTAFARALSAVAVIDAPSPPLDRIAPLPADVLDAPLPIAEIPTFEALGGVRNVHLIAGGEQPARARLAHFIEHVAARYHEQRDRMDLQGTSRLSADLRFGTLSPRTVWTATAQALKRTAPDALRVFHNELIWREFAHATLWDRPGLLQQPFQPAWQGFPWLRDQRGDALWRAWADGQTGYPIVDAAARQLLHEGFVHNRARMISASFLTKHLLVDYKLGEAHYLRYLVDGDLAQNNAGWQWSAGCGCDAQPYFRVFNPVTQGERFDPDGAYVRRFVPELAQLPSKHIHAPWQAPSSVLRSAHVELGRTYPRPIVEHAEARERFLALAAQHVKAPKPAQPSS